MITVKHVTKRFGGVAAVNDCSLTVKPGIITSIIGPNGAGKTTLFNLICGIISPDNGEIFLEKRKISELATHQIARLGVSRTFQQARLFKNMTVGENLRLAKKTNETEIRAVLERVQFKLGTSVRASDLSFGQMRLVELARGLIKPHTVLLLDEPTAGVNPRVRQQLKEILVQLNKEGKTIVLIEHDMEFVMSISEEVTVMAEGTVLTQGTPAQVQKDKRVLEAYLGK